MNYKGVINIIHNRHDQGCHFQSDKTWASAFGARWAILWSCWETGAPSSRWLKVSLQYAVYQWTCMNFTNFFFSHLSKLFAAYFFPFFFSTSECFHFSFHFMWAHVLFALLVDRWTWHQGKRWRHPHRLIVNAQSSLRKWPAAEVGMCVHNIC